MDKIIAYFRIGLICKNISKLIWITPSVKCLLIKYNLHIMEFTKLEIDGAFLVHVMAYHDNRGIFQEHYNEIKYQEKVSGCKQISFSESKKNVIRGIHCSQYGKLVQCITGTVIDTIVDFRENSPTYLKHCSVKLTENDNLQIFVPAGCGHSFISHADNTFVLYAQEGCYDKQKEMNVNAFDPALEINWDILSDHELIISDADKNSPMLIDAKKEYLLKNKN
jgi:dTDP-4-dehydrorhamnose 3,5-epimerase